MQDYAAHSTDCVVALNSLNAYITEHINTLYGLCAFEWSCRMSDRDISLSHLSEIYLKILRIITLLILLKKFIISSTYCSVDYVHFIAFAATWFYKSFYRNLRQTAVLNTTHWTAPAVMTRPK